MNDRRTKNLSDGPVGNLFQDATNQQEENSDKEHKREQSSYESKLQIKEL